MDPLLLDMPTEFSSDRLLLRRYRPGDGAMYYQMLCANWDHLYEFLPASLMGIHNEDDAEAVIRQMLVDWNLRSLFIFGVWEKSTGVYVGESYLANADWDVPSIEVGYFILKASTGKGYATEAASATIRYAFEHLQAIRVELRCAADNPTSMRVAKHCGFVHEGLFRQDHRKKDGTLVDMHWFGLLLSEWQIMNPGEQVSRLR
jgi:RimJ/RimL family protein N-acetyltransferase